jgi:hypothetical protein
MKSVFGILLIALIFGTVTAASSQQSKTDAEKAEQTPAQPAASGEDFNNISADTSGLRAAEPLLGEQNEEAEFTRDFLQVQWRNDDPIDLFVIRPAGVAKAPAIIYLYSYPVNEERYWNDDFCKMVTKNGFAAIGFVSALDGQRYHNRPMKQWFISELQESLVTTTHDVQMVLNYLSTRGDIDMDRIGMFGDGSGATIAILAAAADSRIKAVDLLNPWGDWPEWMAKSNLVPENERQNFLKPEFLRRIAPFDPVQWLPKLKSQAVRMQIIADVAVTPKAAKERMASSAPAKAKIIRYESSEKFVKESALNGKVFDWLEGQINPKPTFRANKEDRSGSRAAPKKANR